MSAADASAIIRWMNERGLICAAIPTLSGILHFEPIIRLFGQSSVLDCAIGAYSYLAPNCALNRTTVGRYCSIGGRCDIGPTQHPNDWLTTSPIAYKDVFGAGAAFQPQLEHDELKPVAIGNDVWIGTGTAVMGGVTIGDGAIVGYGSIVTRDVEPYAIVAGSPARMIRRRFPDALAERIAASRWWDFDLVRAPAGAVRWDEPERALDNIAGLAESGAIHRIPPVRHRIARTADNQYSFSRLA